MRDSSYKESSVDEAATERSTVIRDEAADRNVERDAAPAGTGHPVRGAILITVVVVAVVVALIFAVFRFVVRPQTENVPRVTSSSSL